MSIDDSYGTADETNHNETVGIAPIHHHQHQHINYIDAPMKRKKKSSEAHTYGSFVAYCFCVNYILGVGVLGRYFLMCCCNGAILNSFKCILLKYAIILKSFNYFQFNEWSTSRLIENIQ